jgi:hypothetical protein
MTSKYECNSNRDAVLLCNLMRYQQRLPFLYRNFDSTHHQNHLHHDLNKFTDANPISNYLGGSVVLADYCPFMQQVSWSINNEIRDSKCSFDENKPDKHKNYILEQYGKQSKCFLHNRTWQIYSDKCQSRITVSKTIGCYKYECDPKKGLLVKINDNELKCSYKDQVVEFTLTENHNNKNMTVYFGNIVCPSCEEICKNEIKCPVQDDMDDSSTSKRISDGTSHDLNNYLDVLFHVRDQRDLTAEKSKYYTSSNYLNNQHEYCIKKIAYISNSMSKFNSFYVFYLPISTCLTVFIFNLTI